MRPHIESRLPCLERPPYNPVGVKTITSNLHQHYEALGCCMTCQRSHSKQTGGNSTPPAVFSVLISHFPHRITVTNWAQWPRHLRKPERVEIRNGEGQTGVEGIRWSLESQLVNIEWGSALGLGEGKWEFRIMSWRKDDAPEMMFLRWKSHDMWKKSFFSKFQGFEKNVLYLTHCKCYVNRVLEKQ